MRASVLPPKMTEAVHKFEQKYTRYKYGAGDGSAATGGGRLRARCGAERLQTTDSLASSRRAQPGVEGARCR
ncbi:hypothetical protein AV530_012703 [Patagioenas fasciata monilis]|uniref:Uncharacterized protein n=1 Tax=Patagioenas fasciata monilis TaxID=372326 RepID=A0A1V4JBU6_PATFA|nr:hypothetical protein AV530_012703 [Patagioenas fasciata monilis]